jgi:IstB-like ATP binding protein
MKGVELYAQVRYAVRIEGLSRREAARRYGIDPRTVAKMLAFSVPPGYRRSRPPARPKLDPFTGIIDRILARGDDLGQGLSRPSRRGLFMSDTPQILLAYHLKALKLPTFLREYDKLAQQCAAEGVDHPRYLLRLAELELIERERRMVERRIKEARFPTVKSLDSFDFTAIPSLNKTLVLELARCEYIARRENVIAVGNSGTGKSHIALGLGLAPVRWRPAARAPPPSATMSRSPSTPSII